MLTTSPHLRTRRPSPTTVEYTVSTSPTLTLSLHFLIAITFLFRFLVGITVLLLLYSKYLLSATSPPGPITTPPSLFSSAYTTYLLHFIHFSLPGTLLTCLASITPIFVILPLSLSILYTLTLRIHTTESVLVLRGLGIQTSTSSTTYMSTATTRFIPTEKIQDILVNEAFRGWEVRYYLIVVVEGEESVVVVFPRLLPKREIVEVVWRGVRGVLWEPGRTGGKVREREREKSVGE